MKTVKSLILLLLFAALAAFVQGQDFVNFADGEGVLTELVFINPTDNPVQFLVEVYDQEGQPAEITLEDFGNYSYFFIPLKVKEVWSCRTTGDSLPFKTGRLQIIPMGPGMAVVTIKQGNAIFSEQIKQ